MDRSLILVGLILVLGGCRPVAGDAVSPTGARDAVPADADWHFMANGDRAELTFGAGEGSDAEDLFRLACRLNAQRVSADWETGGDAVLTSGTATGTFQKAGETAADHPVFNAFRAGGTLSVGLDEADLTLTAKDAGRAQIAQFFQSCTRPLPPPAAPQPAPAPAPAVAGPSESDDQTDDLPGVEPVEPGVDVVQPDQTAQQPVDG